MVKQTDLLNMSANSWS